MVTMFSTEAELTLVGGLMLLGENFNTGHTITRDVLAYMQLYLLSVAFQLIHTMYIHHVLVTTDVI